MATFQNQTRFDVQLENGQWLDVDILVDAHFDFMGNSTGYTLRDVTFRLLTQRSNGWSYKGMVKKATISSWFTREIWKSKADVQSWLMGHPAFAEKFNSMIA